VVWKDLRFEKEGNCRTGVKFGEITSENMKSLKEFLTDLMIDKSIPKLTPRPNL
jgi:hypothetical protein